MDAARPAVEGWIEAYEPELVRHLTRLLGTEADARDALQLVWIKAFRSPPRQDEGSNVRAWLHRVATNQALDCLATARRRRHLLAPRDPALTSGEASAPDDGAFGLGPRARALVRAHCAALPRKQREAVWMRWVEGLDYPTIAQRLDSSPESARANVYQGMKRLRAELDDLWKREYES